MSIRVSITCDTPDCGAYCSTTASEATAAREHAAARWGWSVNDRGLDHCGPCTRSAS